MSKQSIDDIIRRPSDEYLKQLERESSIRTSIPLPDSMTFWYSITSQLKDIPQPETIRVSSNFDEWGMAYGADDSQLKSEFDAIRKAADIIGYPCFLRNDIMSGKHNWNDACYIEKPEDIEPHASDIMSLNLMMASELHSTAWFVREFLELDNRITAFNGMPVSVEVRSFVNNGKFQCMHSYWPEFSITEHETADGKPITKHRLDEIRTELKRHNDIIAQSKPHIKSMVERIGREFVGYWSIDLALGKNGTWYCTDMGPGYRSFHWPDCPKELHIK